MLRISLISAVCGFSLALPARASWLAEEFSKLDTDRDGRLTAAESSSRAKELGGADANGDGSMTLDEVVAHVRGTIGRRLREMLTAEALADHYKKLDKDGDGRLAGPELAPVAWLRALDADGDQAVTLAEVTAAHQAAEREVPAESIAALDAPPPAYQTPATESNIREEPRRLKASEFGVGLRVSDPVLDVLGGGKAALSTLAGPKGTVLCVLSPSCPVAARQRPELARLSASTTTDGFGWVFLEAEEPLNEQTVTQLGLTGRAVRDADRRLRAELRVATTTEVFVIDAARTLVYRGALDDRYGVGWSREEARFRYVEDALKTVTSGRRVESAATTAPGCDLEPVTALRPEPAAPTFHNRISRLMQTHCQQCHHQGGLGPFPLETFADVTRQAGMIRRMVRNDLMPPWFAAAPPVGHPTPWANDRSLPADDKAALLAWLDGDRPEGDPAEAPLPVTWPADWTIRTPHAVFQVPQPIPVKAEGTMPYHNVIVETHLTEDRWVQAWEVLPTARPVVHHVLIWARDPAAPAGKNREDDESGFFAAYVPGNNSAVYQPGLAKKLPAGSRLRFQIHYTPNGTATHDQVRVGIVFAPEPPLHAVEVATIAQPRLSIPAGASAHPESASIPVPADVRLIGLFPHMHVRGKAFRYEVLSADGTARTLLHVPRYDFNWQLGYQFAEPPVVPAGHRLRAIGWFDNSADNPHNPDPARTVPWGPQTEDEMMIGYAEYYVPSQPLPRVSAAR
ncbi:MAG: hypothetical protein ACKV19_09745 [Verrucomicrobiales bacterium]